MSLADQQTDHWTDLEQCPPEMSRDLSTNANTAHKFYSRLRGCLSDTRFYDV